jgi:hypothetical protein
MCAVNRPVPRLRSLQVGGACGAERYSGGSVVVWVRPADDETVLVQAFQRAGCRGGALAQSVG